MVELVGDELPALVLARDQVGRRDAHLVPVDGADVVRRQQVQPGALDAGQVHGGDEDGDAPVSAFVAAGADGEPAVVGVASQAGPHLLPGDHVTVAVADGFRAQRGEVGAGVGLGVPDAEVDLAPQDAWQVVVALLLAAEMHQRGCDRVDREHGHRGPGPHRLVEEDELLDRAPTLPAVLGGPANAEPAVGAHLADHPAHDGPDAVAVTQVGDGSRRPAGRRSSPATGCGAAPPRRCRPGATSPPRVWRSRSGGR